MRPEFLKVRSLPTPKWCLFAVALFFVVGLVCTFVWGLGPDRDVTEATIGLPLMIASIVFGVWMVGVEYGQKTLRQVLTADPRRGRLVISKLLTIIIVVTLATTFFHLIAAPLFSLGAGQHDQTLSMEYLARTGASSLVTNLLYALLAAPFALLAASTAGGLTLTLVFVFVLDGLFSIIPKVGDYAFGLALTDINDSIVGTNSDFLGSETSTHTTEVAALTVIAWLAILLLLGFARFRSSDVK